MAQQRGHVVTPPFVFSLPLSSPDPIPTTHSSVQIDCEHLSSSRYRCCATDQRSSANPTLILKVTGWWDLDRSAVLLLQTLRDRAACMHALSWLSKRGGVWLPVPCSRPHVGISARREQPFRCTHHEHAQTRGQAVRKACKERHERTSRARARTRTITTIVAEAHQQRCPSWNSCQRRAWGTTCCANTDDAAAVVPPAHLRRGYLFAPAQVCSPERGCP